MKNKYTCKICNGEGKYTEDSIETQCHHCNSTGLVNYKQIITIGDVHLEIERMKNYKSNQKWMVEVSTISDNTHHYKLDTTAKSYKQALKKAIKNSRLLV